MSLEVLQISISETDGVSVFSLSGRLDSTAANDFRDTIVTRTMHGAKRIVLDFGGLSFVDSSGFGALAAALSSIQEYGGRFVVISMQEPVRKSFELIRMDRMIDVFADMDSAFAALR